jgi:hypothetical protein
MNYEVDEQVELEKYRSISTGLASNPATSSEYLNRLLEDEREEEVVYESPDWMTPQNQEELRAMIAADFS